MNVYEEAMRRLHLKISVTALHALYGSMAYDVARTILQEYAIMLRKLRVEFDYAGDDGAAYRAFLNAEFLLGKDPLDIDFDHAHAPSGISWSEAETLVGEYRKLLLEAEGQGRGT